METVEKVAVFSNKRIRKRVRNVVSYFFLVLFSFLFLFPIFCLFLQSVLPDEELYQFTLFPAYFNFQPYKTALSDLTLFKYLLNTLVLVILNILGSSVMSSVTAFGLSKVKFKGQDLVFSLILATVFLPSTVTSIPLYAMYLKMGWTTTNYPLWVPLLFGGGAMNIFLMRQFMRGIPKTYTEAAILDGASNFHIYLHIVLPLIKPIFIYLSVQTFFGVWNDFQGPLMYLEDDSQYTLSLALYLEYGQTNDPINLTMAVGVLMMVPCAALFAIFQKQLMEGVSTVGIKG
ncbi:MAG: carbohydrate ABC transporter permease [Acutalibacteraceae bacterium]|jgi:multiple sugar transport system permease protein|nr:carbohydrate ABC transporter permease [Acutalibacteraceae bacterium]MEE1046033.1 carbohydrate ABC transporter permease [Clostridia bacterium]